MIGLNLSIDQLPDGRILIEAKRVDGERTCIDSISIGRETSQYYYAHWALIRKPGGVCRSRFVYPEVPDGYMLDEAYAPDPVVPPHEFVVGRTYVVLAEGVGMTAEQTFVRGRQN